jgi:eukaryotic-like serine/threonine-protein kinase
MADVGVGAAFETFRAALADRYRIERELGRGGMATVYLAHDLRHDRPVALKVLNPDLSALLGVERFNQEIRVTARLRHPHILPLYDSGEAAGALYYVMPLVEGESLRARMDRAPALTVEEAVRLAREVADALSYAHDHGVIHRDIKPENILLENGRALVADFGIARTSAAPGDPRLTRAGLSMGTPLYMSPEQASGEPDFDGRSDLYSLACVLFEMLAGQPPFTGASPEAVLVQRFTRLPPRLSSARPAVPASIDLAVHRAMARAPAERFETMGSFSAALTGPVATVSGGGEKSIAVLPFTCMSTEADTEYFGDGMAEEIINALTQLPGLKVAARTSSFSFKGKNEDLRQIGEKLGVGTVLEGSFRRAGKRIRVTAQLIEVASGYHLWSERYDREYADVFAIQDEIATGIADKLKVTLAAGAGEQLVRPGTANVEAYDLYLKGRAAMRHRGSELWKAIEWFEQAIALDPAFALAHAGLAQALTLANFWGLTPSSPVRDRAMSAAALALASDPLLPEAHHAIGVTGLMIEYDRDKASRSWERAIELDPGKPESHILHAVFDLTYVRREGLAAERELRGAIEQDPESSYAYTSLAVSLSFSGRSAEAIEVADRAVELDGHSFYAQWVRLMATALLGRHDEVLALAQRMGERFGRHPWILMAISIAAGIAKRQDTADAAYNEVTGRASLEYVQRPIRAVAAMNAGRRDEAFSHLRQAVRERDALMAALATGWPGFAPIRGTPEFDAVLREMGWL